MGLSETPAPLTQQDVHGTLNTTSRFFIGQQCFKINPIANTQSQMRGIAHPTIGFRISPDRFHIINTPGFQYRLPAIKK